MARGPVGRASNGCPERRLVRWLLLGTHGLVLRARNHERRLDGDGRRTDRDREDAAVAASRDLRNDRHPPCAGRALFAIPNALPGLTIPASGMMSPMNQMSP